MNVNVSFNCPPNDLNVLTCAAITGPVIRGLSNTYQPGYKQFPGWIGIRVISHFQQLWNCNQYQNRIHFVADR